MELGQKVKGQELEEEQVIAITNKMPRPFKKRNVLDSPSVIYFKPSGIKMMNLENSILKIDEFEAIRLKDFLQLYQEECAKKMNISQPTFHRLILNARKKIADAIVNGKAIKIEKE